MIAQQEVVGCECTTLQTFIKAFRKMLSNIVLIELMVVISGISMTYVLKKKKKKDKNLDFYSPGGICHLFRDKREELQYCSYNGALKCGGYCEKCQLDLQVLQLYECKKGAVY